MKNLKEYIFEQLILESKTYSKLSHKLCNKVIKIISNNDEKFKGSIDDLSDSYKKEHEIIISTDDLSIYKFEDNKYNDTSATLFVLVAHNVKGDDNELLHDSCEFDEIKNNHFNSYIFINLPGKKTIDDVDNTVVHEIRHFYDKLIGQDINNINNTYENGDQKKYDGFLYHISPTEQNAFFTDFKRWISKRANLDKIKGYYQKVQKLVEKSDLSIDEFLKTYSNYFIKGRRTQSKDDIDKGKFENSMKMLEYKYYILDSEKSLENFINYEDFYEEHPSKEREQETKNYIINHLSVYTNGNKDIKILYKEISKKYNNTFNNYKQVLQHKLNIK